MDECVSGAVRFVKDCQGKTEPQFGVCVLRDLLRAQTACLDVRQSLAAEGLADFRVRDGNEIQFGPHRLRFVEISRKEDVQQYAALRIDFLWVALDVNPYVCELLMYRHSGGTARHASQEATQ